MNTQRDLVMDVVGWIKQSRAQQKHNKPARAMVWIVFAKIQNQVDNCYLNLRLSLQLCGIFSQATVLTVAAYY